ncbi:MAG: carbohydrate ABC transporter permease [Chloroflexi bacterium]|jgi:ABC-type glycerol-3-phosphate transport system permease component|nr:carbohydrate ABC transporter permease [Chloroflexota bacterium]HLG50637.1 carbohydrate ABC transporter permease [Chloroflexota bacterium]
MSSTVESVARPSPGTRTARSVAWWQRRSTRQRALKAVATLIAALFAVAVLFPVVWMISTSLKTTDQTAAIPIIWVPIPPQWHNYIDALTAEDFGLFFRNTAIITVGSLIGTVLSSSLAAFGFARLRAPGRNFLFILVLSTLMLPAPVTIVPRFILFTKLHWINTFLPLIVPAWFGGGAFNVFLLRQFFMTVPREMDEAARIDGAGFFQIYWRIMLPMSLPALGIVCIFHFIYAWNDFFEPLIFLNNNNVWTVAIGLAGFTAAYGGTAWNLLMAASLVAMLPCVLLFFVAQRYFVQGVVITGVKG